MQGYIISPCQSGSSHRYNRQTHLPNVFALVLLSSARTTADFAVISGRSVGSMTFAFLVVAARAIVSFAGRFGDPVFRILSRGCVHIDTQGIRGGVRHRSNNYQRSVKQEGETFHTGDLSLIVCKQLCIYITFLPP